MSALQTGRRGPAQLRCVPGLGLLRQEAASRTQSAPHSTSLPTVSAGTPRDHACPTCTAPGAPMTARSPTIPLPAPSTDVLTARCLWPHLAWEDRTPIPLRRPWVTAALRALARPLGPRPLSCSLLLTGQARARPAGPLQWGKALDGHLLLHRGKGVEAAVGQHLVQRLQQRHRDPEGGGWRETSATCRLEPR